MRKLLNTIFITTPKSYLALDGQNLLIKMEDDQKHRMPLHNIEAIITTGYPGISPALMRMCADQNITITFLTSSGKFGCRVVGKTSGNVYLRKKQYQVSEDEMGSLTIARNFIIGKLYNQRWMLERMIREHTLKINVTYFKQISQELKSFIEDISFVQNLDTLRGIEGQAASRYFSLFDQMILQQKEDFRFYSRNRRPPLDNVNALLSFTYTLLSQECTSALEMVGLDPYVGFMHQDRPGRTSLAQDLMEELRGIFADRFILTLINKKMMTKKDFIKKENGTVLLTDEARKRFFLAWQKKKNETIQHPFLGEKITWGIVPYAQALLLSRFLRGDLDGYPPFLWK
ncbi:type I-C CRISPR-associated endonuclease Cas1c [Melissococcus plutonius]|uniref:type I-C CRISPR-associated endonuclease Cas1c n=1 Tax=Melissococcus plutonius TaxID=33970 RepID=UPI00065DE29F|nr:type I-C CRISPR-associated endonuclease Cas1c [Melissococcus plutonius]AIM25966.1 CRISPR-associated endonuclease Cas1 [Melissococcus plutonius S1]KMT24045.1 CRISPR-associated endonuclease Cas1 [Melissococcus plutonius]KMT24198.1 CRISPR-associated endonuclease Cas1 [Melissococcus plutonius]KMT25543.1 CRISPR-associated endonuclease Cas1 [Melissococcus plutonius]KMT28690.1 CRISPR-associated endonuclease Cas1 [Melissococcus plutonius]